MDIENVMLRNLKLLQYLDLIIEYALSWGEKRVRVQLERIMNSYKFYIFNLIKYFYNFAHKLKLPESDISTVKLSVGNKINEHFNL